MNTLILAGYTLGLHLVSAHAPALDWHNNTNIGVYVVTPTPPLESSYPYPLTFGTYVNTLGRNSTYVGTTIPVPFTYGYATIALGVISGYKRVEYEGACRTGGYSHPGAPCFEGSTRYNVGLMAAPSVRLPIPIPAHGSSTGQPAARITYIPGVGNSSSALHLSLEYTLN